ncbi:EamA family transporter RarD [Alcaligenes sp. SDU_A2]|uniref:EamA family transporter RarD n=1 Tax=Alcaligenes sp. SDU_A2 TaxID=3136634 RepID=UPI002BCB3ED4|nr:EamA family transporter RarD [Alcaligenes sp.]HRL28524.1 EamA family transporter RarD [Alcaligenes sp.]
MKQGVLLSVFASSLFALLYFYATVLQPLSGEQIFAWRIVLGLPALALVITRARRWREVRWVLRHWPSNWRYFALLALAAALVGVQLWIFVWAPLHQMALDVSLGYFLLPLMMVLVGRVFYKDTLTRLQWLAVALAAVGVLHELWRVGGVSWATAVVVLGYPPYFMLRRYLRLGSLASLWFDLSFLFPAACWLLFVQDPGMWGQFLEHGRLFWQVPVLGLISSVALVSYLSSSRQLPLALFGILGYVEPVLLFWVAYLLLDEPMSPEQWWTYIPIWTAIFLVALEGGIRLWRTEHLARRSQRLKPS